MNTRLLLNAALLAAAPISAFAAAPLITAKPVPPPDAQAPAAAARAGVGAPASTGVPFITAAPPGTTDATPGSAGTGTYRDSTGGAHNWSINGSRSLVWDGQVYAPAGGAFEPRYWTFGQTDANWAADVKALETLKLHGVGDLYLTAGNNSLLDIPAPAVQKVIDYLDSHGFHYGVDIGDLHIDPLTATVVKPAVFRQPAPTGVVRFGGISGLTSAVYVLAASNDPENPQVGAASLEDARTAVVDCSDADEDTVLLLYPTRVYFHNTPESHMPDLWQGYDSARDRLLECLGKIRFGPGLRFFLDPLGNSLGMAGDADDVIPTSDGFRLAFDAWLSRKYANSLDDLNTAWGISDRAIPDFETAARCCPLWNGPRGVLALYDPVGKTVFGIGSNNKVIGHCWEDIRQFKRESLRASMNAIADVIKKNVADVPVVYRCNLGGEMFVNDREKGGYDGLGIVAYGQGQDLVDTAVAPGIALAEQWNRPAWMIVANTADTANPSAKQSVGYESRDRLVGDWDGMSEAGARGIFAQALQRFPDQTYARSDLLAAPEQLDWLASTSSTIQGRSAAGETAAQALWYPAGLPSLDIHVQKLDNGTWWLPAHRPGALVPLGRQLRCYMMPNLIGGQPGFVVWSPGSRVRQIHVAFDPHDHPIASDSAGLPVKLSQKGGVWTLPIGSQPLVVQGIHVFPVPDEAVDDARAELQRLIGIAEKQNVDTTHVKQQLFYATNKVTSAPGSDDLKVAVLNTAIEEITDELRPYAWIEGESAKTYTFDTLAADAGASGGSYLSLNTDRDPPDRTDAAGRAYVATYPFTVNTSGRYAIWLAGSELDTDDISPFSYQIDGGAEDVVRGVAPSSASYGGKFYWTQIGAATLTPGRHTITLAVYTPRRTDGRYVLAVDALCLDRAPFRPDGPARPTIETTAK